MSIYEDMVKGPRIPLTLYDGSASRSVEGRAVTRLQPTGRLVIEVSVETDYAFHVTAWESPAVPMLAPMPFHEGRVKVGKNQTFTFELLPNLTQRCPTPDCPLGLSA